MFLSPEDLIPKKIAGKTMTCEDQFHYFQSHVGIYDDRREIPEPQSIFHVTNEPVLRATAWRLPRSDGPSLKATAEVQHRKVVEEAPRLYKTRMDELNGETPTPNPARLQEKDGEFRGEALTIFDASKKMGDEQLSDRYKTPLERVCLI